MTREECDRHPINDNVTDVIGKVTKSCPISLILTRKEHAQKGNPAVHRL